MAQYFIQMYKFSPANGGDDVDLEYKCLLNNCFQKLLFVNFNNTSYNIIGFCCSCFKINTVVCPTAE